MAFCPVCGTQIVDGTSCPRCAAGNMQGTSVIVPAEPGLTENVAGALAYTVIAAIVFVVIEPYKRKRFIRFHSLQAIFLGIAWIAIDIALAIIGHIPLIGAITVLLRPLASLAIFLTLLFLAFKAYQGEMFKLPVVGEVAAQQAGSPPSV